MSRTIAALLVVIALLAPVASPVVASDAGLPGHALSAAVAAQEGEGEADGAGTSERRDGLDSVVIWSLAGLGIFALLLGAFYFFKRQVGGFPENPSWTAPITIMASKDFVGDEDVGEAAQAAHGQTSH